jgi:hypothetical protein
MRNYLIFFLENLKLKTQRSGVVIASAMDLTQNFQLFLILAGERAKPC